MERTCSRKFAVHQDDCEFSGFKFTQSFVICVNMPNVGVKFLKPLPQSLNPYSILVEDQNPGTNDVSTTRKYWLISARHFPTQLDRDLQKSAVNLMQHDCKSQRCNLTDAEPGMLPLP